MSSEVVARPNWDEGPDWFDIIDIEKLELLSAIGWQPKQIAMYFDIPLAEFMYWFSLPGSKLKYHFERGGLLQAAKEGITMAADAASGKNITQAQRFDKKRKQDALDNAINQIFYPDIL